MDTNAFHSKSDYDAWLVSSADLRAAERAADVAAVPSGAFAFCTEGYCSICDASTVFVTSMEYVTADEDGNVQPNGREHLICKGCGLRSRVRSALQIAIQDVGIRANDVIYITEQFGPTYRWLKGRFNNVTGSEYLKPGSRSGSRHMGINHQVTPALSFGDASFDVLMSLDVLEHVPDNAAAFYEIARVLRPGGSPELTIPFTADKQETTVHAQFAADGTITDHLPVEMHGNPTDPINGAHCFRHCRWDWLDEWRAAGFTDVKVHRYHSADLGHRCEHQIPISAKKGWRLASAAPCIPDLHTIQ